MSPVTRAASARISRRRLHVLAWGAVLAAALSLAAGCAWSEGSHGSGDSRVVLVVAGNLSIRDICDPNRGLLGRLLDAGCVGLMNVRTGRPSRDTEPTSSCGMEAGCVSIGAGAMAVGGAEVRRASDPTGKINGVQAAALYKCRTGSGCGSAAVLHTEIAKIHHANDTASYHASPGALGSALHAAGIRTAIIGNADLPGEMHREAVAVAMDEDGLVDLGGVRSGRFRLRDKEAPYGVRTDWQAELRELDRVLPESRFVVIDFGDTFRADSYAEFCTDEQAALARHQAVARLEKLLSGVLERLRSDKDLLILLSPNSRTFSDMDEERLTPIVLKGPGYQAGMLTSPSTRTDGVVTISDVAPTVLHFLGVDTPPDMVGRPMGRVNRAEVEDALLRLNAEASGQARRQSAMRGGSIVQSVIVVMVTLAVFLPFTLPFKRAAAWIALIPIAMPLVMLYLPVVYSGGLAGAVLWLIALTLGMVGICIGLFRRPRRAFVWLCGAIVLSLAIDLLRGAPLIASSIAGYSIVEGARYYGIGNELMGTMLGAVLLGVGMALSGSRLGPAAQGAVAAGVLCVVFVLIGAPGIGANAGGAVASVPAIAVMLLARRGWRPSGRGIALVLLMSFVVVGGLFALDAMHGSGSQSHVGRAAGLAAESDASSLLLILERKAAVNFMLLANSPWSRLLVLSLVGAAAAYWWGRRRAGLEFLTREQGAAVTGCCVAVAGAFAFNDSGVVAAATCSVPLWTLLTLRALLSKVKETNVGEPSLRPSDAHS